jgi:hypothetical protein
MTVIEKQTLEKLTLKLDYYMRDDQTWKDEDKIWKKGIDDWKKGIVQPLIDNTTKEKVVKDWLKDKAMFAVKVVSFIGALGLAFHYVIGPLLGLHI